MPANPKAAAIILAAGLSSRLGQFKPLLELAGRPLLARAVEMFRAAGVRDLQVVTGHRGEEVAAAAAGLGIRAVANPAPERGMLSSVQTGLAALPPPPEGPVAFFLLPVDIPLVRPATVRALWDAWQADAAASPCGCLAPAFGGESGHPPLIAARLREAILGWDGPRGLEGCLAARGAPPRLVEVADQGILWDMDTPADLARLRDLAPGRALPSRVEGLALLTRVRQAPACLVDHGRAAALVALALARAVNPGLAAAGRPPLDLGLVAGAALLHDLARGLPDHARTGAEMLTRAGFAALAPLVAAHMDLGPGERGPLDETRLIYLADKLVEGCQGVGLAEKFQKKSAKLAGDPAALAALARRREQAFRVAEQVEAWAGREPAVITRGVLGAAPPEGLDDLLAEAWPS
ncbi:MAG: NTP transferase domain-containing protein [Deltaproteobacteria bacterium]|nr:NTP transferase domain-containing protein [Deltaproteobacteria bacterium]MCB2186310.1 NTP transferase domain-containing protein [Deltaproteobacteria bacterium]